MKFLDQAKVYIRAGSGGAGAVSFLREKFVEFGGPNGGDGGRGGDVIVECVDGLNTLIDYRYQQHFKAGTGVHGMGKNRTGADGRDVVLKVPVGTQVFEDDNETLIADLTEVGQRVVLLSGGNGGFGNAHFKTSNQGARAGPIRAGRAGEVDLAAAQADRRCGPSACPMPANHLPRGGLGGEAKIADYPFTTRIPISAWCGSRARFRAGRHSGADRGRARGGLGDRFLGHVERCKVLVHLIDGTQEDVKGAYRQCATSLRLCRGAGGEAEIVVLNKVDALDADAIRKKVASLKRASKAR